MATTCDINGQKPQIEYPCDWEYKLIVLKDVDVKKIVKEILKGKEHKTKFSHDSKEGKYKSYNLSTLVTSDDERKAIFEALKADKNVKYVL